MMARPLRALLRAPIFFDVSAFFIQARDLLRPNRAGDHYTADDPHHRKVHDYNAGVTEAKRIHRTRRTEEYYQVLNLPARDLSHEKVLSIGPRNVLELYVAWLYGFSWSNITGVDLYSTNPKIVEMNMEKMTFEDDLFDAAAMSSTLAYAEDTKAALSEVYRVLKPGGRFVFGQTHVPDQLEWPGNRFDGDDIKAMLDDIGFRVFFYEPHPKINSLGQPQTSHMFGVVKPTGEEAGQEVVSPC